MKNLLLLLLLAGCAIPPPVLTPEPVDMPISLRCEAARLPDEPDLMGTLPPNATLTHFVKACAAQNLYDRAAIAELKAALKACSQ